MRSEKTARSGITTDPGNLMFIIYISLVFCALLIGTLIGGGPSKASTETSLETIILSEKTTIPNFTEATAEITRHN
ncbi:hypothetical protein [Desulfotalea psychrophila]|uniref:hypothetical protein n=1 Tax=Desulfotalea psychrophila TaxID=84980 RepID=UPI0002D66315|nr:hypothetical protein [Desulfotalea psychrophila]